VLRAASARSHDKRNNSLTDTVCYPGDTGVLHQCTRALTEGFRTVEPLLLTTCILFDLNHRERGHNCEARTRRGEDAVRALIVHRKSEDQNVARHDRRSAREELLDVFARAYRLLGRPTACFQERDVHRRGSFQPLRACK
jgi:hypothetical protein